MNLTLVDGEDEVLQMATNCFMVRDEHQRREFRSLAVRVKSDSEKQSAGQIGTATLLV